MENKRWSIKYQAAVMSPLLITSGDYVFGPLLKRTVSMKNGLLLSQAFQQNR